jgi:hypothetical protein
VSPDDRRRHQVEAAGPVALLLEAAVADFAQAVEQHGACQRVTRFSLVQSGTHAAAQLDAFRPKTVAEIRREKTAERPRGALNAIRGEFLSDGLMNRDGGAHCYAGFNAASRNAASFLPIDFSTAMAVMWAARGRAEPASQL